MTHSDFKIGETFFTSNGWQWLCTDKGTRVIVAVHIEEGRDPSWLSGPPYAVAEVVFDEHDFSSCTQTP
jgi:hypothetical protein